MSSVNTTRKKAQLKTGLASVDRNAIPPTLILEKEVYKIPCDFNTQVTTNACSANIGGQFSEDDDDPIASIFLGFMLPRIFLT